MSTPTTHTLDIREEATWIIDWAAYLDDIQSLDPEIAVADGYRNAVLPAGALTVAALPPECLPLDLLATGGLCRSFRSHAPVVAGDRVGVMLAELPDGLSATFTRDGQVVATETLRPCRPAPGPERPQSSDTCLATGPIDALHVTAVLAGLMAMRGEEPRWDQRSAALESFALRLLLPSLIAVNAAAPVRRDIARRLVGVDLSPLVHEPTRGSPFTVRPARSGGNGVASVTVTSGGHRIAAAEVELNAG